MQTAVVELASGTLTSAWQPRLARIIELAASDPAVDRLFVHPAVKQALCTGAARGSAWLRRVRPWWAHHDHFHARLKCPEESPACKPQEPLPAGDGCGDVAWWFTRDAKKTREQRMQSVDPLRLPDACEDLVGTER